MSKIRRYVAGVISGTGVVAVGAAVGLWLTPFALRFLDQEEYAVFVLAQDVLLWLVLADFGITGALIVKAAHAKRTDEGDQVCTLASTAFAAQSLLAGVVLVVGVALAFLFDTLFSLSPHLMSEARAVMVILAMATAVSVFSKTFSAILVSQQLVHVDNSIKLVNTFVRAGGVAALLLVGCGLQAMAWGNLAAALTSAATAYAAIRFSIRRLRIGYRDASWQTFRSMLSLGIWFFINSIAFVVLKSFDRVISAKVVSLVSVAALALTGRMYGLFLEVLNQIARVALPFLGETAGGGDSAELLEQHRVFALVSLLLSALGAATLWAGNGAFVVRWVGQEYYAGPVVDMLLASQCLLFGYIYSYRNTLSAALIVRPQALLRVFEGLGLVVLCVFLGRSYGLAGIALGKVLATALTAALFMPLLFARAIKKPAIGLAASDLLAAGKAVLSVLPGGILGRYVAGLVAGYPGAVAGATTAAIVGGGALYGFCLPRPEKARLHALARQAARRMREKMLGLQNGH